jgi:hypothetical protein
MNKIIGNFGRNTRATRWTLALAAGAVAAMMAAATPAAAQDPQATPAQIDNSLSYEVAAPSAGSATYPAGAYAAAPRRHRSGSSTRGSGAYASAHTNAQPAPPTPPHKDFQDYK